MIFNGLKKGLMLLSQNVEDILKNVQSGESSEAFAGIGGKVQQTSAGIYSILVIVALSIFLIVGSYGVVKGFFMGSPAEREEFKKSLAFRILCIVLFASFGMIIALLYKAGGQIFQ